MTADQSLKDISPARKAAILAEALPYIKRFFDKTIDNPIEAIVLRNPTDLVYSYRTWRNNPNQATLRGGIWGSATNAAPVSPMSARQMAFQVAF